MPFKLLDDQAGYSVTVNIAVSVTSRVVGKIVLMPSMT
jgi:hypothetical protein